MPRPFSNLRVFVDFKSDTVFAGEDIECTITLKNVDPAATTPTSSAAISSSETNGSSRHVDALEHLKASRLPSQHAALSRTVSAESQPPGRNPRGSHYRSASSLSVVESAAKEGAVESPTGGVHIAAESAPDTRHTRRVSIVSLSNSPTLSQRPPIRHGRSASVQASPVTPTIPTRPKESPATINTKGIRNNSQSNSPLTPSPLSGTSTPPQMRPSHARSATVQLSERWLADQRAETVSRNDQQSGSSSPWNFHLPSSGKQNPDLAIQVPKQPQETDNALRIRPSINEPPSSNDPGDSKPSGPVNSFAKVFSVKSVEDTPRSSMDIYSASNHSNETLVSEYPSNSTSRLLQMPQLLRTSSQYTRPTVRTRTTESLMMGYVQLSGSFSLDGSLVNQSPFEEVKRKAVVGGQGGGGVVGLSRASGDGGLFGGLSWGSIGESIGESFGGLMGGSNLSSIKEMKSIADSSAIPLLSTSKSILFIDLKLGPGQSKRYSYRFKLPRGLPPSHRGRAMKVTYNLIIGVQRSNNNRGQQQIKQVEVPFRVFSSINQQGDSLGHDLMSPYIILKDQAQTSALEPSTPVTAGAAKEPELPEDPSSSASDFETYVNQLLAQSTRPSSQGLISPTAELGETPVTPRSLSFSAPRLPQNLSARELIDQTIRYCSNPNSPQHLSTNFTIARASVPIATLTLSRSALRLGDLITCVVDFTVAKLPCYAFEASLESSEKVDPALAIRSPQSVERATRKVWARSIENALWAKRCIFRAQVPVNATPAFTTTGVGLDWSIRLELVVGVSGAARTNTQPSNGEEDEEDDTQEQITETWAAPHKSEQLLEVVAADERATVLTAMQHLPCDSFEVTIPIRVFGAIANNEETPPQDLEGLVI